MDENMRLGEVRGSFGEEKKRKNAPRPDEREIKLLEFMFSWILNMCSDFHISRRYQPLLAVLKRVRLNIESTRIEFQPAQFVGTRHKAECVECNLEFRWNSNDDWTHRLDLSIECHLHFHYDSSLWRNLICRIDWIKCQEHDMRMNINFSALWTHVFDVTSPIPAEIVEFANFFKLMKVKPVVESAKIASKWEDGN